MNSNSELNIIDSRFQDLSNMAIFSYADGMYSMGNLNIVNSRFNNIQDFSIEVYSGTSKIIQSTFTNIQQTTVSFLNIFEFGNAHCELDIKNSTFEYSNYLYLFNFNNQGLISQR